MGTSCSRDAGAMNEPFGSDSSARSSMNREISTVVDSSVTNLSTVCETDGDVRQKESDSSAADSRPSMSSRLKSSFFKRQKLDHGQLSPSFVYFPDLSDDIIVIILSYVSYAPMELDVGGSMTLSMLSGSTRLTEAMADSERLCVDYNNASMNLNSVLNGKPSNKSPFNLAFRADDSETIRSARRVSSLRMFGTLTHVLPLVDKRLYRLCSESDLLWKDSLLRLMSQHRDFLVNRDSNGELFEKGVESFIETTGTGKDVSDTATLNAEHVDERERVRCLVDLAVTRALSSACPKNVVTLANQPISAAQQVLREVALTHMPTRLTIFAMTSRLRIGEAVNLVLFEPRYRLLIAEVMTGRPEREKQGFPIFEPRPKFLFLCRPRSEVVSACLVEVRRCRINYDGSADVMLVPSSWVLLDKIATRPNSGALHYGIITKNPARLRFPVLCMAFGEVLLGEPLVIRFFEPRFRALDAQLKALVAELMKGRSKDERNGAELSKPLPRFIFACRTPFEQGSSACMVEVTRCMMHANGTATLTFLPTDWVLLQSMVRGKKSGSVCIATALLDR